MPEGELWSSLVTAIDPGCAKIMPAILESTIDLLETELARAKAALQEIQPNPTYMFTRRDELALGAVAAYRQNPIDHTPDFFYGARRLTPKELGLVPAVCEVRADDDDHAVERIKKQPQSVSPRCASLIDVLSNTLILDQMAPHLSTPSLFALAATSSLVRSLIMGTPYVFRHLDLTQCRGARVASVSTGESTAQINSSSIEDQYNSAPLRGVFAKLEGNSLLQDVRTLILDGLSVPASLVEEIVLADRFNINILSIRECRHLNERRFMQVVNHAVRPSRPKGTPRVKGIYYFTPLTHSRATVRSKYRDWWGLRCSSQASCDASTSEDNTVSYGSAGSDPHRQNAWYRPSGQLLKGNIEEDWAQTIHKCEGIIAFDAVLCRGPRHNVDFYPSLSQNQDSSQSEGRLLGPRLATVALGPRGCEGCHTSPEGPAIWGQTSDEHFPLLTPPPFHASSVTIAKRPVLFPVEKPTLIVRCTECLTDRWCHRCNRWFCTDCLLHPEHVSNELSPHQTAVRGPRSGQSSIELPHNHRFGPGVSKDCWECGPTCSMCKAECQRTCYNCRGDYCVEHNEGCSSTMCDWCNASTRNRMRELY
ncbi:hypothetical protein BO71DRAFT_337015 [Aspergillus ellipticus CBS 707.79]|uniref:Ubiquitin fusion degradation protein n=1 Tax=Aspergillus ellipticus CBS 707.79 TaxID=1448320 RepID=A0A319CVH0_9EURO|nr:hypothetical protein BO71DRAFT_337015 [Aspergillus ellipticus CBS 707.79]